MNILWVTSEAVPYAKTGGLADVSGALPQALAARGHKVSVIMPWYPQVTGPKGIRFDRTYDMLPVPMFCRTEYASVHQVNRGENLTIYFIEYNKYFDRPRLYDWAGQEFGDNAERFTFFCRAAMETALMLGIKSDILHANDWHAALCCVYLRSDLYRNKKEFSSCRSVLTIHNIGYQGNFDKGNMINTGLSWDYFNCTCLEYYDRMNFLKGGIMTADFVNTVSPTYAKEILSCDYGFGLDPSLRARASEGRLRGILNGIDDCVWDPANDKLLPKTYSANKMSGKDACRTALQKYFGLPVRKDVPVFSTISRLASQKGLDVFVSGLEDMLYHDDFQFVVIGSGEKWLEDWFNYLKYKYPTKMAFYCGYASDEVSHLAEAGADFFVMPSRYEPCGLNQMYSMRYGTLPVVRATGGLADTVTNFDYKNEDSATGFVFWDLYPQALNNTIRWAADVKKNCPAAFKTMRHNAMTRDFSWNNTASLYERMYSDAHR